MFLQLSAPISVQWELTPWCNHLCIHCYNFWRADGGRALAKVTPELIAQYDQATEEIIVNKVFAVTLTGGEPLAVFDTALPFLQRLRNAGIQMSLNSNLTLLTPATANQLWDLGIRSVLTSLMAGDPKLNDSLANTPGAHKRTVRGIQIAQEQGLRVSVNMVATHKNIAHIYSTAQLVKSLGVSNFSATKAATPGNAPDFEEFRLSLAEFQAMLKELLRVHNELGLEVDSLEFYPPCTFPNEEVRQAFGSRMCTAGRTTCTIGFDGHVRPCSHAPMAYGMVQHGLEAAWERLNPWRTDELLPEECKPCPAQYFCGGGCKSEAYVVSGSLDCVDPYCTGPVKRFAQVKKDGFDNGTEYALLPSVLFREEAFGGILYRDPAHWIPANKVLYQFIQALKGGKSFRKEALSTVLGTEEQWIAPTLQLLEGRGIIRLK